MTPKTLLAAFSGLAMSASTLAALAPNETGQFTVWPGGGEVAGTPCTGYFAGRKPGAWFVEPSAGAAAANVVYTLNNECRPVRVIIDPVSKKPVEFWPNSHTEAKVVGAKPAPEKWWELPQIRNARPTQPVLVNANISLQNNRNLCQVDFRDGRVVTAAPGTLLVPDLQSAYYIARDRRVDGVIDGSADYCKLEPLVQSPDNTGSITVAGGGLRNPGVITVPPVQTQPAGGALPLAAAGAAVTSTFLFLSEYWSKNAKPLVVPSGNSAVIAFNWGVDVLLTMRNVMGLTAIPLGTIMRNDAEFGRGATKEEAEKGIEEASKPATEEAERLSKEHDDETKIGGNCTPERHAQLEAQKRELCYNWDDGPDVLGRRRLRNSMICKPSLVLNAFQILVRARMNAACARVRDQIRNECFDGGDANHREESRKSWEHVSTCLNRSELK